jgi:hypothetical protein
MLDSNGSSIRLSLLTSKVASLCLRGAPPPAPFEEVAMQEIGEGLAPRAGLAVSVEMCVLCNW